MTTASSQADLASDALRALAAHIALSHPVTASAAAAHARELVRMRKQAVEAVAKFADVIPAALAGGMLRFSEAVGRAPSWLTPDTLVMWADRFHEPEYIDTGR